LFALQKMQAGVAALPVSEKKEVIVNKKCGRNTLDLVWAIRTGPVLDTIEQLRCFLSNKIEQLGC